MLLHRTCIDPMNKIYTSQGLAIHFILHFLVSTNLYMNNTDRCYELKCVSVQEMFKLNLKTLKFIPTIYHFSFNSDDTAHNKHIVYFSQTFSSLGHQCRYKYTFLLLWVNNRTLEHSIIHSVGKNYKKYWFLYYFFSIEHVVR